MKSHTYSLFKEGMDVRYTESDRKDNGITSLTNCYIDRNNRIKKRPGTVWKGALTKKDEYDNRGLFSFEGKKWVVTGKPVVEKLPDDVWQLQVHDNWPISLFYSAHAFLGGIYLALRNGSTNTHWYTLPGLNVWEASTVYAEGDKVLPTAAVMDSLNAVNVQFHYEVTTAGTSAGTEPTWGTANGGTTADGTVTWTTRYSRVTDENCPETPAILALGQKIYAIGTINNNGVDEHDIVRYSATGLPTDWTTANDAGFLPVGIQATGSETPTALGKYNSNLAVFFEDAIQIWAVDPDPIQNALIQTIGGVGTKNYKTQHPLGTDLLFLSQNGVRSVGQQAYTVNAQDNDVGAPVDPPVAASLKTTTVAPVGWVFPELGQYWCCIGRDIWVWTWSRDSEVRAWAHFKSPNFISDLTYMNGVMYGRTYGGALLAFDPNVFTDLGVNFDVTVEFAFQSNGAIGVIKQYTGADVLMSGTANISMRYNSNNPEYRTIPVTAKGNTRPGAKLPVECMTTEIAPVIQYKGPDDFILQSLTLYYETLNTQ